MADASNAAKPAAPKPKALTKGELEAIREKEYASNVENLQRSLDDAWIQRDKEEANKLAVAKRLRQEVQRRWMYAVLITLASVAAIFFAWLYLTSGEIRKFPLPVTTDAPSPDGAPAVTAVPTPGENIPAIAEPKGPPEGRRQLVVPEAVVDSDEESTKIPTGTTTVYVDERIIIEQLDVHIVPMPRLRPERAHKKPKPQYSDGGYDPPHWKEGLGRSHKLH